jgi:uracil-DNA glycosylase
MVTSVRGKVISRIVKMEERINKCNRCKDVRICFHRPSTGKGDVEADILVVFASESEVVDRSELTRMRQEISAMAGDGTKVYHTFMVRCQPKMCNRRKDQAVLFDGVLINSEGKCLLKCQPCDANPVKPDDQQTMNCLHFLLEEIEILAPELIIVVGERVYQYVFRAFGIFDPFNKPFDEVKNKLFRSSEYLFITAQMPASGCEAPFSELSHLFQIIPDGLSGIS